MTSEEDFVKTFEQIKASYQSTVELIGEAASQEDDGRHEKAIEIYKQALKCIDEIFAIPVGVPNNRDAVKEEWQSACLVIEILKRTKPQVVSRLKKLEQSQGEVDEEAVELREDSGTAINGNVSDEPLDKKKPLLLDEPPPIYGGESSHDVTTPKSFKEVIKALRRLLATKNSGVQLESVFQSQAKLYRIEPDGVASTLGCDTAMSVIMCRTDGEWAFLNGIFFIQCIFPDEVVPSTSAGASKESPSDTVWIYPLVNAPICRSSVCDGFILPDLESETMGAVFRLIITDSKKNREDEEIELEDLRQFFSDLLEAILGYPLTDLNEFRTQGPEDYTSRKVSNYIVSAAEVIAKNVIKGAEKTGDLMVKGTPYVISKMDPASPDAPPVPSTLQTSVEVAKTVTSVAAGATGWVAGKVGTASAALGRYLAPHIQTHGATLLQKSFGYSDAEANSKMEGGLTIAGGALEGFTTVYNGVETAAKILGTHLSTNSVKIIEHKYGSSAGSVAADTFDTIGNAFNVSQNVNYITPKGLAKKMVKQTGKAIVTDYTNSPKDGTRVVPAGSLYVDIRDLEKC